MALAVGLGAFGAHALEQRLELLGTTDTWQTAVNYQALHALALLIIGAITISGKDMVASRFGSIAGWLLIIGNFCFSYSLYHLALFPTQTWIGPITPLGGLLMILGWLSVVVVGGALANAERAQA